ncbi:MAG: hypothetical protein AB7L76_06905 [Burkholderiaceae bacterium]
MSIISTDCDSQQPAIVVGGGQYDRTRAIQDGRAWAGGRPVRYLDLSPAEALRRSFETHELAAAEVSLGVLAVAFDEGRTRYRGLPAFVARSFRHGSIFVRNDGSVLEPRNLASGRIGLPDVRLTTAIWVRGMLSDQYGLDLRSIVWTVGGIDAPAPQPAQAAQTTPAAGAADLVTVAAPPGRTLWQMLADGELDAVIAARTPAAIKQHDPRFKRMFTNFREEEEAYFKKTGCFPPMHMIAYDTKALDSQQAGELYEVFRRARDMALVDLEETAFYHVSLPWLPDDLLRARHVMGSDLWSYGFSANRTAIDTFLRYCHEQGITRRRLEAGQLFLHID